MHHMNELLNFDFHLIESMLQIFQFVFFCEVLPILETKKYLELLLLKAIYYHQK